MLELREEKRNEEEAEEDHHQKEYLLVCDLPSRFHSLHLSGLKVPDKSHDLFLSIEEEMIGAFQKILPEDVSLRVMHMASLTENILERAHDVVRDLDNGFIVSTCTEISHPAHGMTLEVNRLYDFQGNFLGIGPRPGHPDLNTQIHSVLVAAAGRPLVFIEDGTFTGATMCSIIKQFCALGARVGGIVLGFAFPGSKNRLEEVAKRETIHLIHQIPKPVDWMPDHDFFPLVPNCGRVIGCKTSDQSFHPFYNYEGWTFCIPYLTGYCPMKDWAGLNASPRELHALTYFFLKSAASLFGELEKLNGTTITVNNLRHSHPRVSIPCVLGQQQLPEIGEMPVTTYLREVLGEID